MPTGILDTPDTTVHYDLQGAGPPLLLIPGGTGDAGVFGPLSARLASRHTVIGMYSRVASGADGDHDQDPVAHVRDVVALLDRLADGPVAVFASSSGAVTALELLVRCPDRVSVVVAHEPVLVNLLPDAEKQRSMLDNVRAAVIDHGAPEAMAILSRGLIEPGPGGTPANVCRYGDWYDGYADSEPEPPAPELSEVFVRLGRLHPVFLRHILYPFATHTPDMGPLADAASKLVPAAGIDSRGQLTYRTTAALADRFGLPLTEFPGGHVGPVERPRQFAEALMRLLAGLG